MSQSGLPIGLPIGKVAVPPPFTSRLALKRVRNISAHSLVVVSAKKKFPTSTSSGFSGDKGALAQNEALQALRSKLKTNTEEPPRTWSTDNASKSNSAQGGKKGIVQAEAKTVVRVQEVPLAEQFVRVQATRKGKGGKTVTIVSGIVGDSALKKTRLKVLKAKCGAGGKLDEDGNIEIQGDQASSLVEMLVNMGYTGAKKSGGK